MSRRTIVITGTSRGLGRALAEGLIAAGNVVVGCSRSPSELAGGRSDVVDVSSDESVSSWARDVIEAVGAPDLLVNNAAIINENAPLWEVPPADFDAVIDVNIKGVMNVIRHFAPAMIARGSGVIVNMSSGWGRSTSPDVGPYCTTKWAIEGLSSSLADDLPAGLASVALNPGVIDTEMLRTCWGEAAGGYQDPASWAERAVPVILGIGVRDSGRAMTV